MSKGLRTLLAIGTIELLLLGLWFWLAHMAAMQPERAAPDAQEVIGRTIGTVMGVLAGLAVPLYLMARKNDRR